ncbi:hypothetical protein IW140_001037 [Coemansia sp. RSA 1813]|nr:hypothetical protein EV178_005172 [Coemansia sp. RSA 1646]KAJ1769783.1 hypothetical protein LPJ74_003755 [Coemansia sp. RSA 1843]KAJ2086863.1 hypothetical protein IW138_005386 [Coemansia sp. RSA 986]KAJ2215188.1 hypothetical protein EV179_002407 [Coemansia sp. RSA 487]KAJ2572288.1 hypothetical protein IW140_001037 [Coemansia sp. RSA 1813]
MAATDVKTLTSQAPFGGRYVALLRRTNTGMLFSDPVFVKDGQSLPELPDGLQYVVIHPSAAQAKDSTMKEFVPSSNSHTTEHHDQPQRKNAMLPLEEDYGMFSSFLPSRDSSLSSFTHTDYNVLNSSHGLPENRELETHVSTYDLESALEVAERVLGRCSDDQVAGTATNPHSDIPQDILKDIEDVGLEPSAQKCERQSQISDSRTDPGVETAESILKENNALLIKLVDLQDKRALANKFDDISSEEMAIAAALQNNIMRVVAANKPSALRPSSIEIKHAASALLAKRQPVFSGVLPPQKRFAFVSNVASSTEFPQGATTTPMQRQPIPR